MVQSGIGAGLGIIGAGIGGKSTRKATKAREKGIQDAQIQIQGGTDQALARIDGTVDTTMAMNRPYSDTGIGAMANINAMLGIGGAGTGEADMTRLQGEMDTITKKKQSLEEEIDEITDLLNRPAEYWNRDKVGDGKYKGKSRDEMAAKLEIRNQKKKALETEYKGIERNFRETQRTHDMTTAANENASGISAIQPFQFDGENFEQDPSYQFRRDEALEAVNRSMGAGGFLNSGNRAIGIADRASQMASTEYQSAFDRGLTQWRSQFDVLRANLEAAGIGQRATGMNIDTLNNTALAGAQTLMTGAGQKASLISGSGDNTAAGIIGQNNALQQGLGQVAYGIGQSGWFDDEESQVDVPYDVNTDPNNAGLDGLVD